MAEAFPTFDESWHRIADRRIRLRPGVDMVRQIFRGRRWYVLKDPFSNQFFRLRPAAHDFICRLEASPTVAEAWEDALKAHPDDAPGQGEVVHLLSQLYRLNLLRSDLPGDSRELFERLKTRRHKEQVQKWTNVLFLRIPLWNPDAFLVRTLPMVRWMISWFGFAIWLAALLFAGKLLVDNWQAFQDQSQSLLSRTNLPWLYLGLILTKAIHEFGHGYFCRRFGGEVPVMGVMLLILNPLPYVDASSSWSFRERRRRILVASAGMIVELFLAAVAMMVWVWTAPGGLHNLAYNMVFIASVATILFNLNPLLRFDGYHILCDLLDTPNLQTRSQAMMSHWIHRYLFGLRFNVPPTESRKEAFWLTTYFVASFIYRIFLFAGIILFIADRFLLLGVLLAILGAVMWGIVPLVKTVHYLLSHAKLARCRTRAVGVSAGMVAAVLAFLFLVPMPAHFRSPGVLRAREFSEIHAGTLGRLEEIVTPSGRLVARGDILMRFSNPELEDQLRSARAELEAADIQIRKAGQTDLARYVALQDFRNAVDEQIRQLEEEYSHLVLLAPHDGRWIAPGMLAKRTTWVPKGFPLGQIVNEGDFYFSAVVRQSETSLLFTDAVHQSEVKLYGQEGRTLSIGKMQIIPADREFLPSASLGLFGGGDVAVTQGDNTGRRATEPFFEVRAGVDRLPGAIYQHGTNGKARFAIPAQPLMEQWMRKLRQLFQRRYEL